MRKAAEPMRRILTFLLALSLCLGLTAPAFAAEFSDVPAGYVFHDSIQSCVDEGLLSGYQDGTFRPGGSVTRAQFNVMLARVFYPGEAESGRYDSFKQQVGWYGPYSAVLKAHGAMPYGDQHWMDPAVMGVSITRRDMARFLSMALQAEGFVVPDSEKAAARQKISDFDQVGDSYADAVETVFALGIITGYADNAFAGKNTMTRGQASAILYRTSRCIAQGPEGLTFGRQEAEEETEGQPAALVNGKAVTEENVLELLRELRTKYPEDADFSAGYPLGNDSPVRQATYPYQRSRDPETHTSNIEGCGGWSTQISDTIFGQRGYPCRKVDLADARPSDVMVQVDENGRLVHVATISSRPTVKDGKTTFYVTEAATDS